MRYDMVQAAERLWTILHRLRLGNVYLVAYRRLIAGYRHSGQCRWVDPDRCGERGWPGPAAHTAMEMELIGGIQRRL